MIWFLANCFLHFHYYEFFWLLYSEDNYIHGRLYSAFVVLFYLSSFSIISLLLCSVFLGTFCYTSVNECYLILIFTGSLSGMIEI